MQCDLKTPLHTQTHTPSRVREKCFPLLSFLSQQKTTSFVPLWDRKNIRILSNFAADS